MTALTRELLEWIYRQHPTAWVNLDAFEPKTRGVPLVHGARLMSLERDGLIERKVDYGSTATRWRSGRDRFARVTDAGRRVLVGHG